MENCRILIGLVTTVIVVRQEFNELLEAHILGKVTILREKSKSSMVYIRCLLDVVMYEESTPQVCFLSENYLKARTFLNLCFDHSPRTKLQYGNLTADKNDLLDYLDNLRSIVVRVPNVTADPQKGLVGEARTRLLKLDELDFNT